jgi:hypothetical protein
MLPIVAVQNHGVVPNIEPTKHQRSVVMRLHFYLLVYRYSPKAIALTESVAVDKKPAIKKILTGNNTSIVLIPRINNRQTPTHALPPPQMHLQQINQTHRHILLSPQPVIKLLLFHPEDLNNKSSYNPY